MFPQIFGKYVLERELAAGGMARVYLATLRGAVGFEKKVVVKQIRPELACDPAFVARFVDEAKTAVELSHPNIVPVYELGVEQGVYYIAMEFCAGRTLAEILAETGALSPEEGAYLGVEICRALDYAHRRGGIVHRDVTPRNVLVDEEGAVRLIDFGIAAPVADSEARRDVFGSPGHMPPEQLAGQPLAPSADVFAAAALLVEAWTAQPPFRRATARESEEALLGPVTPLEAHSRELEPLSALIGRALALDAKVRPQQAEHFARPLRDFLRSVDAGDVARTLGARVARASTPAAQQHPSTASAAAAALPGGASNYAQRTTSLTRTFAAREEVTGWAGSRATADQNTRKLPSEPAPPPHASWAPSTARLTAAAAVLALVVGSGLALSREPRSATPPVASASRSAAASRPAVLVRTDRRASAAPMAEQRLSVPTALRATTRHARALSSSGSPPSGSLRLTADPPAQVSIHGRVSRSFSTPARDVSVPAGAYTVTFRSPTYGEPLVASVELPPGAERRVHADFREAEPRVSVR